MPTNLGGLFLRRSILLLHLAESRLEPGVGSYLLPMHGQELIARRPLGTHHGQPVEDASVSSIHIDPMMGLLTCLEQGHQSLTSHMGHLELGQATIQTHLTSLDTWLTTMESDMQHAIYSIYHDYFQ